MSFLFGNTKEDDDEKLKINEDLKKTRNELKSANETIAELSYQLEILQESRAKTIEEAVKKATLITKEKEQELYLQKISDITEKHQAEIASKDKEFKKVIELTDIMHKREISFIEETKEGIIAELNRDIEVASQPKGFLSNILGFSESKKRRMSSEDFEDKQQSVTKRSTSLSIF